MYNETIRDSAFIEFTAHKLTVHTARRRALNKHVDKQVNNRNDSTRLGENGEGVLGLI